MNRYLDSKADLTFKKIFGEHKGSRRGKDSDSEATYADGLVARANSARVGSANGGGAEVDAGII